MKALASAWVRGTGFGAAVFGAVVFVAACTPLALPEAPSRADLAMEVLRPGKDGPPAAAPGICWQSDVTPLVIETVSEQVMVQQERLTKDGRVEQPAAFRTETHQRIVQEREEVWFRSPCPEEITVDFIATLQRALKARGYYVMPLTGEMDTPTREAVHRFQIERGLDSPQLSLAAARELGIVATDLDQL